MSVPELSTNEPPEPDEQSSVNQTKAPRTLAAAVRDADAPAEKVIEPLTQDEELERLIRNYLRAGWWLTNQRRIPDGEQATLTKNTESVRLQSVDGKVTVDGPSLPPFPMTGHLQAWLLLIGIGIAVFVVAGLLGFFN